MENSLAVGNRLLIDSSSNATVDITEVLVEELTDKYVRLFDRISVSIYWTKISSLTILETLTPLKVGEAKALYEGN